MIARSWAGLTPPTRRVGSCNTRASAVRTTTGPKLVVYSMVANALAWWGLARQIPADVSVAARVSASGNAHPADVGI